MPDQHTAAWSLYCFLRLIWSLYESQPAVEVSTYMRGCQFWDAATHVTLQHSLHTGERKDCLPIRHVNADRPVRPCGEASAALVNDCYPVRRCVWLPGLRTCSHYQLQQF